ncbi:hypothetical protein ABK040_004590 [Willaertia magna]
MYGGNKGNNNDDEIDLLNDGDWDVGFNSRLTTTKKLGFSTTRDFTTTLPTSTSNNMNGSSTTTSINSISENKTNLAAAYNNIKTMKTNISGLDSDDDDEDLHEDTLLNSNISTSGILSNDLNNENNNLQQLDQQNRFLIEEIEFQFTKTFTHVCATKGNLLLATDQNTCIYVDDNFDRYREFKIRTDEEDENEKIYKCFIDPSGYHVIITINNGDNYYFNTANNKNPKIITNMKNILIESIGWDIDNCNKETTGTILIGTNDSKIYECKFENDINNPIKNSLKLIFDFNECEMLVSSGPINGIFIEPNYFGKVKSTVNNYFILVITPFRMFEFIGGPTFQDVFQTYQSTPQLLTFKELPAKKSDLTSSELHVLRNSKAFAWLSNAGIFHGNFKRDSNSNSYNNNNYEELQGESLINECEVIQMDSSKMNSSMQQGIKSIAISEFHMFILYPEKLTIVMQPPGLCTSGGGNSVEQQQQLLLMNQQVNNNNNSGSGTLLNNHDAQQDIENFFYAKSLNRRDSASKGSGSSITGSNGLDNNGVGSGISAGGISSNGIHIGEVSLSDIKVVHQRNFPMSTSGELLGLCTDLMTGDVYLYSNSSVYRIEIDDEERDVWKLYLEQALDPKSSKELYFDIAYKLCKNENRDIVLSAKADYYFKMKRYMEAASIYAMTTKSFEQVSISFHNKGQKDALRSYVLSKLQILKKNIKIENQDATQLSCLCTWLTEMYLDKMNELYDYLILPNNNLKDNNNNTINGIEKQYEEIRSEFRKFLEQNKKHLDKETTYRLMSSHGQTQEVLFFAMLIEDYERVISHCITEKDYSQALEILNKYCKTRSYEDYFYKFSPILMQHLPREMVNTLTTKRFLDSGKLIPALMRFMHQSKNNNHNNGELDDNQHFTNSLTNEQQNHVIRYLEWCIKKQENEDPAIHNLLLTLYADLDDDEKLLNFLNTEGENNFYDPKYALRICTQKKKIEACVRLYSSMQLYDDAVDLALENDEIELARECADKPEDDEYKKKLWLKIAKHVIDSSIGVKQAIAFLSYTDKIKLEDILPYFPDFSKIDDFKEEICKSLEQYKNEIEKLKSDMHEATQTAALIREDIKELKHRYGYITANAKCDLSSKSILTTDFYLFPCQHVFRADALVEEVLKYTKSETRREKIRNLDEKRKLYNRQMEILALNNNEQRQQSLDQKELSSLQEELKDLDDLLSSECPLCGDMMIDSIDQSFIGDEDLEVQSWAIN